MTDTVENILLTRTVMSSRFPIGVATTYQQPCVSFCRVILLSFIFLLMSGGCQSTTSPRVPREGHELQADKNGIDPSRSTSESSIPAEFIRRLDLAHRPHFNRSAQSIRDQFLDWPPIQLGLRNPDISNFVYTLSEFVLKALDAPLNALEKIGSLRTQNRGLNRAKVVAQSYIYRWVDDCESALSVLVIYEPQSETESSDWSERIWSVLDSPCAYRSLTTKAKNNVSVQGWWDLAKIAVTSNSQVERTTKFHRWKLQNPQHLAARFPPEHFRTADTVPRKIALLLPQTGPLSSAATAIKNGFLSAHLHTPSRKDLSVEVYDTATTEITTLIKQVSDEGVDVIVGPLAKENVKRVLERGVVPVPIIMLNQPTSSSRLVSQRNLVRLAQVVEDDAIAIANQVNSQNFRRVLLILGRDYWSVRAAISFRNAINNEVSIAAETKLSNISESTESIANLLRVTQSNSRQAEVATITRRTIEFTARRRHDVDAIIAFVDQDEFAALSAALHYHFAGDIPIILAEPTFRDLTRAGSYADGTTFTSTPAHLYSVPLTVQIRESFADSSVLYPLYVFGIDAYRTTMHIDEVLRGGPIFGYTGYLRQDEQNNLVREPIWGIVEGRVLKPRKHIIQSDEHKRDLF